MSYTYNLITDFGGSVNTQLVQTTIEESTITVTCNRIDTEADSINIIFESALSTEEKSALDFIVSSYTAPLISNSGVFETVVALDGTGDYKDIPSAFNAGAKSVYVREGTYFTTADIVIPDGGQLIGEANAKVIIYFVGTYGIKCDGNGGHVETTGTFSITSDTDQVVGTGSMFTNISAGQYILIGTNYYIIKSVESDTALTLAHVYRGAPITNKNVKIMIMYTGCKISGMIVTGSTTTGILLRSIRHGSLKSVFVMGCAQNITFDNISDFSCMEVVSSLSASTGVVIKDSVSLSCSVFNVFGCVSHGIEIDGDGFNVIIESSAIENNGGYGYNILGVNTQNTFTDNIIRFNKLGGVLCSSGTSIMSFSSCSISDNSGNGIENNGDCGIISGCAINNNSGIGIKTGLRTLIESCHVISNSEGIQVPSNRDKCIINSNNIINNTSMGINIIANNCIVEGNLYDNNTGINLQISGNKNNILGSSVVNSGSKGVYVTGNYNLISDNIIENNTGDGLDITGSNNSITLNKSLTNGGNGIVVSGSDNDLCHNDASSNTGTQYIDSGTDTIMIKHNMSSSNPGVNDDKSSGYGISSTWVNTTTKKSFTSVDSSIGSAVWESKNQYGSEHFYNDSDAESTTTSTTFQSKISLNTGVVSGDYEVNYCGEAWGDTEIKTDLDGTQISLHTMQDSYWASFSGFKKLTFSTTAIATIYFRAISGIAKVRNVRIKIVKIS